MLLLALLLLTMQTTDNAIIASWSSYVFEERWDFVVTRVDAEQAPRWSELVEDPPLSPKRAVRAAQSELERIVADTDGWRLAAVRIEPVNVPESWVYVIDFLRPLAGPDAHGSSRLSMVVLMDGTAIHPTRRAWPK